MNSNWRINRVGLVDFWYYDDEEFYFQDGRMLLRGSNGSGKSVTMQSLIPLLLDGNMRPERLDSFGSRARKMENYLLEEDDEREERTGYLYMELKREESDEYHSFGIGIRARKNKALDSWYFHINDSRRIGRDIFLYKDQGGKITLTKKELINKIGDGGKVIDEQKEYAILVNEKLFGFEKQEEYKELIDLLIRLRAPKLSKELKPTIVSEILTASLQALSDDELKPMSDAIEKMDETKLNLNNLKESLASIKQIEKIYNLYNEIVLENKSRLYNKALQEYDEAKEKNNEIIRDLEKLNLYIAEKEEEFLLLENEEKILKEEEQSLNSNDVTKLKESQLFIQNEIEHINKSIDDKKHNVEEKEFKFRSLNNEIESRKTDNDYLWKKIEKNFKEMETTISELPFDDFHFMRDELVARKLQDYSFDLHRDTLEKYVRKVKESKLLLERQKKQAEKCDDILKELDNLKENQYLLEKNKKQCEILFSEEKESLIESIYEWERKNTELKLSSELMQMIEREVYDYEEEKNYFDIQNLIVPSKEKIQGSINREIASIDNRINEKINIIREKQTEINDWKTQKEAEPFRSEAVVANRKKLKEADIEFLNFYKAIDFNDNLSQMQKNRIEEALSDMGILDALIVSAKDREKISLLDSGFSDKYIFDDINPVANNILDLFIIEEEYNNILTNGKISRALSSIGFEIDKQAATWISGDGAYGIGVIEGRADSGYQSSFIGSIAREKFRLNRINELEKEISKLELEKKELEAKKSNFLHRSDRLTTEWKNFPEMKNMDTALVELRKIRNNLSELAEKIKIKRDELNKNKENLDNITILVRQACAKCYLKERLDIIEEALLNLDNYKDILVELINNHTKYISNIRLISINESNLEDLTYDLENIRADIFSYGRKVIELKTKLEYINEQLKLTDYDKIKDRLDFIVSRLNKIPSEKININTYKTKKESEKNSLENVKKDLGDRLLELDKNRQFMRLAFLDEYNLAYVEKASEEEPERIAKRLEKELAANVSGKEMLDVSEKLQGIYHENKAKLFQYNLTIKTLFNEEKSDVRLKRIDLVGKYRGVNIKFNDLLEILVTEAEELEGILRESDREIYEEILIGTVGRKIRAKIYNAEKWVSKIKALMESMETSNGFSLSLNWRQKKAEKEEELSTRALVDILKRDKSVLNQEEQKNLSQHFRSKIASARNQTYEPGGEKSFYGVIREVLDYRKWFEFELEYKKAGEKKRELTDRVFFTFSGGEKAMSMYVPLFSAVVAKYESARRDAPKLIALDEAFAGVDEMNIRDMFRLMVEFDFNFIINSQSLWGDYDTVPALAIYQLIRPENAKYITTINYIWNGKSKKIV